MFKNIRNRMKNEKGLTLVELLAVIVILGIVAAIAVPSIGGIIQKSKEDAVKSEALQVLNAAKLYVAGEPLQDNELNGAGRTVKAGKETGDFVSIDSYVEDLAENSKYKVQIKYDDDKNGYIYEVTGSGEAGKMTVHFADATIQDINNHKKGDTGKVEVKPTKTD